MREDNVLKPIIERIVSAAEPAFPLQPEMERQAYLLAVVVISGWWDLQHMAQVGRHWSASILQAKIRGRIVRRIMAEVWEQARLLARQRIEEEEAKAAAERAALEQAL